MHDQDLLEWGRFACHSFLQWCPFLNRSKQIPSPSTSTWWRCSSSCCWRRSCWGWFFRWGFGGSGRFGPSCYFGFRIVVIFLERDKSHALKIPIIAWLFTLTLPSFVLYDFHPVGKSPILLLCYHTRWIFCQTRARLFFLGRTVGTVERCVTSILRRFGATTFRTSGTVWISYLSRCPFLVPIKNYNIGRSMLFFLNYQSRTMLGVSVRFREADDDLPDIESRAFTAALAALSEKWYLESAFCAAL